MLNIIKKMCLFSACMILMLHAVIPHHHHSDKIVCFSLFNHNECKDVHTCCDSQGAANHSNNNENNDSHCIIDDFFSTKENHEVKTYLENNSSFFNIYIVSTIKISIENILKNKGIEFRREFISLIYHNPHVNSIFGLRAPPV